MALFVVIPMNLLQGLAPTVNHAVGLFGVLCLVLYGATSIPGGGRADPHVRGQRPG